MPALALGPLALAVAVAVPVASQLVDAPITSVTVFSDRARITRAGQVPASPGSERFELPLLGDRTDPDSIRVEVSGAELKRVDIAHVDAEDFPADEARALLAEIEALDDRVGRATAMRDASQHLLGAVRGLAPTLPPPEPLKPQPRLNPAAWGAAFTFVDGWMDRMQARVRQESRKLADLGRDRQRLAEKARLLGGAQRRSGYRVTVVLGGGGGKAKLAVTYMAMSARWVPSYDIQLLPDSKRVQVAFAGLVSQETGEDWTGAQLVLSTAVPATATVFPKLLTWKIGERERFIPTPVPVAEVLRPPPRAVPPLVDRPDAEALKARLRQLAAVAGSAGGVAEGVVGGVVGGVMGGAAGPMGGRGNGMPADEDRDGTADMEEDAKEGAKPAYEPPPPPPAPPEAKMAAPASPVADSAGAVEIQSVRRTSSSWFGRSTSPGASAPYVPPEQVGLSPPPGYRPPYFGPDLPVTLAGGYDLSFPSLRAETVKSGKEARRVALFSQQWPVEVERRLFPALAPEAYVTAEIKNPSPTALPGGQAQLSVGDDPAGTARLDVVASGEKFVLPLGLDRAIKPIRNVKLVQSEKGVFSKDDVGEYVVTIEIANPYRVPLPLRIIDQLPLTDDKNVEIKPGAMDPAPVAQDKIKGSLEWRITVPAGGKSTVRFGYTLRRPRSWRLHQ